MCPAKVAITMAVLGSALPAMAGIVSVSGATTWLGVNPPSCVPTALTSTNAFAWDEQQNVFLNLPVDLTNNPGNSGAPIPGVVNGNYNSHFVHFDTQSGVQSSGTVTFNAPIVAVIYRNTNLDLSDPAAGALGTVYPTGYFFRGLATPTCFVSISGNTFSFTLDTIHPVYVVDQFRILTAVPAPGSVALLGLGGLACLGRRRTHTL
jgi:hypothetical protein